MERPTPLIETVPILPDEFTLFHDVALGLQNGIDLSDILSV